MTSDPIYRSQEEAVPPPQIASSSIDAVLLGSAGEKTRGGTPVSLSPSGGSSVVQPRRHQIVYMILDPAKEPEDESICAMAISIPAPGSTRTSAEIRVMSTWTATSANIRSDMPWASGSTNEDRYTVHSSQVDFILKSTRSVSSY